jgi:hypothetical protein
VADNVLDYLAEFAVQDERIVSVYAGNEVRAFSNVYLIFFTPFYPFVILWALHFSGAIDA